MTPLMTPSRTRKQGGFLLIEVLVSAVIFAVGVLALVGVQGKMSRAQSSAKDRADAAYLATELQARMWADLSNLGSYNSCPTTYAPCAEWRSKLGSILPGSSGLTQTISVTSSTGAVNITLQWKTAQGDTHSYTTSTLIRAAQ
jgi:type IV pilus assembly protein PilV